MMGACCYSLDPPLDHFLMDILPLAMNNNNAEWFGNLFFSSATRASRKDGGEVSNLLDSSPVLPRLQDAILALLRDSPSNLCAYVILSHRCDAISL